MMETLAELQRLRGHLRDTMARLMEQAEHDPKSFAALAYTRIATECQKLDREIELLSKSMLDVQPPEGIA
jgi:hypothetical protein